jgi:oligopeptide transport system ATP-binding protein
MSEPLLAAAGLVKHYPLSRGVVVRKHVGSVRAVDGVDLELREGETLGIVGESGSGKSTLARLLLALERPTAGDVRFRGQSMFSLPPRRLRELRRRVQIILQDPYTSLNPRMTVGAIVGEPFEIHRDVVPKRERRDRVRDLLHKVGLNPQAMSRYPHEFSGGQRQRIGIARALALQPEIVICDEPVSALDVSVQAQVINLLQDLQAEFKLSYVFIAHDLSIVQHVCDRVAVMYLGKIVETGREADVYDAPAHPYTQALVSAAPIPDPRRRGSQEQIVLAGEIPSPTDPPSGCAFRTRCWKAADRCAAEEPELVVRPGAPQRVACHFSGRINGNVASHAALLARGRSALGDDAPGG